MKSMYALSKVQRGATSVSNSTSNVSIKDVDPEYARINITGFSVPYGGANTVITTVFARITDETTLQISAGHACTVYWEVIG